MIRSQLLFLCALFWPVISYSQSFSQDLGADDRFTRFVGMLDDATIDTGGVRTVFAPTDEAFGRLPKGLLERLDDPAAVEVVDAIVALHLTSSGPHQSDDLPVEMIPLAENARIVVTYTTAALTLRIGQPNESEDAADVLRARAGAEARVRIGDIRAGDALVHGIDAVLLPLNLDALLVRIDDPVPTTTPQSDQGREPGEDFAAQVTETADIVTENVVFDETSPVTEAQDNAAETDVTTTIVTNGQAQDDPVDGLSSDAVTDSDRAGSVVVLEAQPDPPDGATPDVTDPAPSSLSQTDASAPAREASAGADADDPVEITLAAKVISVADLIGQRVSDASGTELGEVTDVLISLDGATAQTLVYRETSGTLSLGSIGLGEEQTVHVDMTEVAIDPLNGSVIVQLDDG